MSSVISIGAIDQAGEIPGNGCLAAVGENTTHWLFKDSAANEVGLSSIYHRLGVTMDHLMEMYWRWKTVRVTMTGVDNIDSDNDGGQINVTRSNTRDAMSEGDLTSPSYYHNIEFGFPYYKFTLFSDPPPVRYHNELYYPSLEVSYHEDSIIQVSTVPTGNIPGSAPFFGSVTMADGTVYNLPMVAYNVSKPVVTIEATEYWAHQKLDGNPKFNPATGVKFP